MTQTPLPTVDGFCTANTEAELFPSRNKFNVRIADQIPIANAISEIQSLCGCVAEIDAACQAGSISPSSAKVISIYTLGIARSILIAVTNGVWKYEAEGDQW